MAVQKRTQIMKGAMAARLDGRFKEIPYKNEALKDVDKVQRALLKIRINKVNKIYAKLIEEAKQGRCIAVN